MSEANDLNHLLGELVNRPCSLNKPLLPYFALVLLLLLLALFVFGYFWILGLLSPGFSLEIETSRAQKYHVLENQKDKGFHTSLRWKSNFSFLLGMRGDHERCS